jgi:hypothetical protein
MRGSYLFSVVVGFVADNVAKYDVKLHERWSPLWCCCCCCGWRFSCVRGGYLSGIVVVVVGAVVCEVLWRVLSCMRGGYCLVLLLDLWLIL